MNGRRAALALGLAAWALPGASWAQRRGVALTDQYIERQQARTEEDVQARVGDIEKRFEEEQTFRAKMKDARVSFERKLILDRKAFLESLKKIRLADRAQALGAYYARQKEKRKEFNEERKAESRRFWEMRIVQRSDAQRLGK